MIVSQTTNELLQNRKVFQTGNGKTRFNPGDKIFVSANAKLEPFCMFSGNIIPSMGSFTYSWSVFPQDTIVGRYCSLAVQIRLFGVQHPYERFTSSSVTYDPSLIIFSSCAAEEKDFSFKVTRRPPPPALIIENDVWIGGQVAIKPGIRIGNGAIVATGAVVTKDVQPYTIVGGVPAKPIKLRFDEKTVEKLLKLSWWDYKFTDFKNFSSDMPIDEFIYKIENEIASGELKRFTPLVLSGEEILKTHNTDI